MRLNMTQQGGLSDEFVSGGGSVINPLFLASDPVVPLGASTKQYVDNSMLSLNANNLISGTIGAARFPAMNGDLSSSSGSTSLILTNTGVTPGAYAKVSVDNKGRILNGLSLSETDIPAISWDKITLNKPTTVDGYGILDALKISGGTMTGALSVTGIPTQSNQLVNKTYLDSVVGGTTGIVIGDIISKTQSATPVGFLKCNGAELVKTSYQDLYNVIGDRYTITGKAGNGQPWRNQYDINTENFSDISNFRTIQSLPSILSSGSVFVTKNRIYVYGGYNGSSYVGTGYTAQINNDGTLGPWSAATALPGVYAYSASIVTKNKVYLLGGYINSGTATNITYVADINADGTIGSWGNGPTMPGITSHNAAFVNNNRVYVVGGWNGSACITSVFSAEIKEDGSLGSWGTETPLPTGIGMASINVIKNRVYIFGGVHNGTYSSIIYSAALNSDDSIGSWQLSGNTPVTLGYNQHQTFATRNSVYIFGGAQSGSHSANIYKATIFEDGSVGNWTLISPTLPGTLAHSNITATKDHLYVIGGMIAGGWSATCWTADISGGLNDYSSFYSNTVETNYMVAGSGKPWQQQYQINNTQTDDITGWVTDTSVLPVNIRYHSTFITKNYIYICGGWDGTNTLNTVYTAPINSDGTLGAWVTGGNLPGPLRGSQVVTHGNKVYLLGGANSSGYTSTVYTTTINSDGTIGTWTTGTSLPGNLYGSQIIVTQNRIYLLGGFNGVSIISTVYTAPIYLDGTIGTWVTGTSLPVTLAWAQAVVTKNRVYLLGGMTSATTFVSTVYTASINADGTLGIWVSSLNLPSMLAASQVIVTKNRVYLLGGYDGNSAVSTVYMANINNDGMISSWISGTSLPGVITTSQAIITKNRVYLLGGSNDNTTSSSVIYSAPILEGMNDYSNYYAEDTTNYCYPGSGRPWETQYHFNTTQAGDITGWTTSASNAVTISIHATIVTKNRVYVGGGLAGNVMYTAPINSDGSLGTFTSLGAVLPGSPSYCTAFVTKNRAYIINGTGANTLYTAAINADGTLGSWTSVGGTPVAFTYASVFITKNKLYAVSGSGSGTSVYYANINADGTLGAWRQSAFNFPVTTNLGRTVVTKNRVYYIGGNQGGGGVTNVWTASIDTDGIVGNWTAGPSLLTAVEAPVVIATRNTIVIGAGYVSGGSNTNVSQIATINADGTIGNWSYGTVFPMSVHSCSAIITSSKIHLVGGGIASGVTNSNVYSANFAGGLNDYSPYFNGDIPAIEQFVTVAKFKLPDASFMNDGLNYFIKY